MVPSLGLASSERGEGGRLSLRGFCLPADRLRSRSGGGIRGGGLEDAERLGAGFGGGCCRGSSSSLLSASMVRVVGVVCGYRGRGTMWSCVKFK